MHEVIPGLAILFVAFCVGVSLGFALGHEAVEAAFPAAPPACQSYRLPWL